MAAPKKATSAKKTTTKKPVAKKAPAKRAATKVSTKTSAKRAKASEQALRSFRRSPSAEPFFTIRINHQTLYWLILAAVVIASNSLFPDSPIVKFLLDSELKALQDLFHPEAGDVLFFGADTRKTVNKVLGRLRNEFADHFELKDPNVVALCWTVDFPFYEWDESRQKVDFGHNPFSMPKGGLLALDAETDEAKLEIVADQYDMVMNGYEICSGGVRNHNPEVLYKVFGLLGYDEHYVEAKFGAMLNAFKYGAPPHAGCAFGVDRMFMELMGESNIREIIAFPKNGSGVDVMMNSPSEVDPAQLKELGL